MEIDNKFKKFLKEARSIEDMFTDTDDDGNEIIGSKGDESLSKLINHEVRVSKKNEIVDLLKTDDTKMFDFTTSNKEDGIDLKFYYTLENMEPTKETETNATETKEDIKKEKKSFDFLKFFTGNK